MWNKYASNGNGFCVGVKSHEVVKQIRSVGKVNYTNSLPEVILGEPFGIQIWKTMFNKEMIWEFEQEHRFRVFDINRLTMTSRIIRLTKESFEEIIFGWNMEQRERQQIIATCNLEGLNVIFYEALLQEDGVVSVNRYLG
jgi:hypothetical protein